MSLQRVITSSGWIDLGDPRLFTFILTGGGGGGGAGAADQNYGGGGGGGGAGAVGGRLFLGGRIYVQIGAGGTAGVSANGTAAGTGGNSYLGVPEDRQGQAGQPSSIKWICAAGGGGGGGGNSVSGTSSVGAARKSLDTTGRPSVTGYTYNPIIFAGCGGSGGATGGTTSSSGAAPSGISTYYPNIYSSTAGYMLDGWINNDLRFFLTSTGTSPDTQYANQGFPGLNFLDMPGRQQQPFTTTISNTVTMWTQGTSSNGSEAIPGGGGSIANQTIGYQGYGAWATGGGGGGGAYDYQSGNGGASWLNRGGESSYANGNTNTYGGGGGAGALKPGSIGGTRTGTTGGAGGAGGFGGGGGGGGQSGISAVSSGGVGGQGVLALFW
jgi:hypothetical protein